jgi:hypothetical protein
MDNSLSPTAKGATLIGGINFLWGTVTTAAGNAPWWMPLVLMTGTILTPIVSAAFQAWLRAYLSGRGRGERLDAAASGAVDGIARIDLKELQALRDELARLRAEAPTVILPPKPAV